MPNQDKMRADFQAWVEQGMWEGEDQYTKNFGVGNVADYWLKALSDREAELVKKIEGRIDLLTHGSGHLSYEMNGHIPSGIEVQTKGMLLAYREVLELFKQK